MRSYSESVSPSSRCLGSLDDAHRGQYPDPGGATAHASERRASSSQSSSASLETTCERHSSTCWPTSSRSKKLDSAAASRPWKASADANLGVELWVAVEVDHGERPALAARASSAAVVGQSRAPPILPRRAADGALPRSWARRSSDSRTATGFRITPIGLGSRSRQSSRTSSIRGSLTPIVSTRDRARRISSRLRSRSARARMRAGGSHHEPPLRLRIALWSWLSSVISRLPRGVEAGSLGDRAQLDAVLLEHPGDRRGAAAVHAEHRDDRLAAQVLDRAATAQGGAPLLVRCSAAAGDIGFDLAPERRAGLPAHPETSGLTSSRR